MTRAVFTIAAFIILARSAWGDAEELNKIAELFNACLPTNWVVARSMKSVPIRGLSNPIAQFTFTETNKTLTCELGAGRTMKFQPTLTLLAFPSDKAKEIGEAVEREVNRSDYPPSVFCLNNQYVFVTSPAYVNRGWHTPEAENSLRELAAGLAKRMTVTYPIEPTGRANAPPAEQRR